jgi:hypothetical protein
VSLDFSGEEAHIDLHKLRHDREYEHGLGNRWGANWVGYLSGDKVAAIIALGLQELKRTYIDVHDVETGSEFCSAVELRYVAKWLLTTNNETMRQLGQLEQIMVVDGLNDDARRPAVPDDGFVGATSFATVGVPATTGHQADSELKIFV